MIAILCCVALISWARAGGAGPSDVEGDPAELKKILWRHARSQDPTRSIRATEVLHRLEAAEREAEGPKRIADPQVTLQKIADVHPLLAIALGSQHGIALELDNFSEAQARAELEAWSNLITAFFHPGETPSPTAGLLARRQGTPANGSFTAEAPAMPAG
jgi:hypothetical protein